MCKSRGVLILNMGFLHLLPLSTIDGLDEGISTI